MNKNIFNTSYAIELDKNSSMYNHSKLFHYPVKKNKKILYFNGNSLGLQPKAVEQSVFKELDDWKNLGSIGYFKNWVTYHETLNKLSSLIVGAKPSEIMIMNALTVNIHLLLISFYKHTKTRYKILIEKDIFPSDRYAIASHLRMKKLNPSEVIEEINANNHYIETDAILKKIEENKESLSLIWLGGVNYYTGQKFDMKEITKFAKRYNIMVGYDLAHAVGNVELKLHDWNVDMASWCNYKYLNSGPGSPSGVYIHEKYHNWESDRLEGWWGNKYSSRFEMKKNFDASKNASGWSISNMPILSSAPLRISLGLYNSIGMDRFRNASVSLTNYLESLIKKELDRYIKIITPSNSSERGCQLSLKIKGGKNVYDYLKKNNIICDWRNPDVIRVAPTPMYNTHEEIFEFVKILKDYDFK